MGPVPGQTGHDSNSLLLSVSLSYFLVYSPLPGAVPLSGGVSPPGCNFHSSNYCCHPYWHKSKGHPTAWHLGVSLFPPKLSPGICVGAELGESMTFCWIKTTVPWSGWLAELQVLPAHPAMQSPAQTVLLSRVCLPCLWCSWLLMGPKGFCQVWRGNLVTTVPFVLSAGEAEPQIVWFGLLHYYKSEIEVLEVCPEKTLQNTFKEQLSW